MVKTLKQKKETKKSDPVLFFKKGLKLEGMIFAIERNRIWVDIEGKFVGFVPKQEVGDTHLIEIGAKVEVSVLEPSDSEGNLVLSMRPVNKEEVWTILKKAYENNEVIEVEITQANRGGLIVCKEGVCGFLPVSQLTLKHYPRVEGGDKDEILKILNSYIGKRFSTRIINFDYDSTKLIFSERAAEEEKRVERIKELKLGEILEVEITGIADFGLFVKFLNDLEGLIHISEVSWERVDDLKSHFETGQKLKAKIVSLENGRVAFSLKRLTKDPWLTKVKRFKLGDKIKGKIKRIVPFGILVGIEEGIEGLVPLSLIQSKEGVDFQSILKEGEEREFQIKELDPESHRLILIDPNLASSKLSDEKKKLKEYGLSKSIITKIIRQGKTVNILRKMKEEELIRILGISAKSATSLKKALSSGKIKKPRLKKTAKGKAKK